MNEELWKPEPKNLNDYRKESWQIAEEHGWHEGQINVPERLALIHSEVSEALEDHRNGAFELRTDECGKPVGFPSEIVDVLIRVFDLAGQLGIDLDRAYEIKTAYNRTRSYRHGGKKA